MIVTTMTPAHLAALRLQAAQWELAPLLRNPEYAETLIGAGPAFAGLAGGAVVGCAGVVLMSAHRGHAWALLGDAAPDALLAVHRAVGRFLAGLDLRRVETAVDSDFAAGHRWARMLGFVREGRMRRYTPEGRDADLYARVKG